MYDPDDAFNRSPPLEAMKPNYGDKPSPPPFVRPLQKDAEATGSSRKPNQPGPQISTHEGDRVLMGHLAPNHPEIAATARTSPLEPLPGNLNNYRQQPPDFDPRYLKKLTPIPKDGPPPKKEAISASYKKIEEKPSKSTSTSTPGPVQPVQPEIEVKNEVVNRGRLQSFSGPSRRPSQELPQLQTSPELKSRISLPSLQLLQPSSGSCVAKSPESSGNNQKLPSIRKALGALSDFGPPPVNTISSPFTFSSCPGSTTSGNDSPFDRPFPGKFPISASPFSHFSPVSMKDSSTNPSPASHSSFWHGPPHSEMLSIQTPYESSPATAKSPATSYPTPTEQVGAGMGDRHSLAASTPQANGGPVGSYKCDHPECTAPPFQTQYLLK
jgi:hypothetical protein